MTSRSSSLVASEAGRPYRSRNVAPASTSSLLCFGTLPPPIRARIILRTNSTREAGVGDVTVDVEQLREEIRRKYVEVLEHPKGEFHFHTGHSGSSPQEGSA